MSLTVIIVAWRVREKLRANLCALFNSDWDGLLKVVVVDNDSADGTAEMVRRDFPQAELIVNADNLGFARACNQAWQRTASDFVLLLNPDMLVKRETLRQAVTWAATNPAAWVSGCRLLDERGQTMPHVRRWPRLSDQLAIALKLPHLWPGVLNGYLRRDFDYGRAAAVDSVRGSFFLVSRQCWQAIGYLDERFFIWFEEVDYCRRVYQAGGEVWYAPAAECVDYVGQGFKQWPRQSAQKMFRDSQLKYFAKWHGAAAVWLLRLAWSVSLRPAVWLAKAGLRGRAKT